ncbi:MULTISPECIES: TraR/DksA family transcriptional regulator [unclassified Metabacillus]|uniref:TraR/DksA family transcriptional regulator n=1 Tax=Metabacillus sp. JX24 TaxID=3240759 RepID=UPI0030FD5724
MSIDAIWHELQLMQRELKSRLFDHCLFDMETEQPHLFYPYKEKTIMGHVKEELNDVERALLKIKNGTYGICEETGLAIELEKLAIIPTARSIHDFAFQELYERKSLPHMNYHPPLYSEAEEYM